MLEKINISTILKEQINTLRDASSTGLSRSDICLFAVFPIAVALVMACRAPLTESFASLVATIMSIFAALLFNVQVLICDVRIRLAAWKEQIQPETKELQDILTLGELSEELYANISYCILLTIVSLFLLFLWYVGWIALQQQCNIFIVFSKILSLLTYSITLNFFLTLLVVTKRSHVLITYEFKRTKSSKA